MSVWGQSMKPYLRPLSTDYLCPGFCGKKHPESRFLSFWSFLIPASRVQAPLPT